ncbi:MAG: trypsin-like peptidase domain-containing protein [Kiritimatiellae bacterium]|nr:trypsin-like peptidase domain-containing protein [Kiritimatiellia bacterium]
MKTLATLICFCALISCIATGGTDLGDIERLTMADPKPFVIVEAEGSGVVNRAQGVVIGSEGLVLSAAHVSWIDKNKSFSDKFRISFRGRDEAMPKGYVHTHKTVFTDKEETPFYEHYYQGELQMQGNSRFIGDQTDVALFKIKVDGNFPKLEFYSKKRPKVRIGDIFHLCHYNFPHQPADPTFLINPVEIVGMAQTSSGVQYLAKGFYRIGSSGGALLKDGKLIGIQSAGYTINAKDIGEIPLGLISFQLVWRDMIELQ